MKVESGTVSDLLDDLAHDNPAPEEKWFSRDDFDPCHGAKELRAAAKMGLIELDDSESPSTWRFRLTPAGRAALAGKEG